MRSARPGGCHLVPLEPKGTSERIAHRRVVVHDQDLHVTPQIERADRAIRQPLEIPRRNAGSTAKYPGVSGADGDAAALGVADVVGPVCGRLRGSGRGGARPLGVVAAPATVAALVTTVSPLMPALTVVAAAPALALVPIAAPVTVPVTALIAAPVTVPAAALVAAGGITMIMMVTDHGDPDRRGTGAENATESSPAPAASSGARRRRQRPVAAPGCVGDGLVLASGALTGRVGGRGRGYLGCLYLGCGGSTAGMSCSLEVSSFMVALRVSLAGRRSHLVAGPSPESVDCLRTRWYRVKKPIRALLPSPVGAALLSGAQVPQRRGGVRRAEGRSWYQYSMVRSRL